MIKEKQKVKGSMGTSSLVCGLVGLFLFPFPLSILAVIFGAIGRGRNEKYANAGLTIGIISVTAWLLIVAMIGFAAFGAFASLIV